MANQQNIISMGRLYGVTVDIEGASALADFEVIEIVDDNNPYPVLHGIDWAFDMDAVINLKKRRMTLRRRHLGLSHHWILLKEHGTLNWFATMWRKMN